MLSLLQVPMNEHAVEAVGLVAAFLVKSVFDHRKGKPRDGSLHRIETGLEKLDTKLDTYQAETTRTLVVMDKRIDGAYAHLIGPDGQNGHRARIEALERARDPLHAPYRPTP